MENFQKKIRQKIPSSTNQLTTIHLPKMETNNKKTEICYTKSEENLFICKRVMFPVIVKKSYLKDILSSFVCSLEGWKDTPTNSSHDIITKTTFYPSHCNYLNS